MACMAFEFVSIVACPKSRCYGTRHIDLREFCPYIFKNTPTKATFGSVSCLPSQVHSVFGTETSCCARNHINDFSRLARSVISGS